MLPVIPHNQRYDPTSRWHHQLVTLMDHLVGERIRMIYELEVDIRFLNRFATRTVLFLLGFSVLIFLFIVSMTIHHSTGSVSLSHTLYLEHTNHTIVTAHNNTAIRWILIHE